MGEAAHKLKTTAQPALRDGDERQFVSMMLIHCLLRLLQVFWIRLILRSIPGSVRWLGEYHVCKFDSQGSCRERRRQLPKLVLLIPQVRRSICNLAPTVNKQ